MNSYVLRISAAFIMMTILGSLSIARAQNGVHVNNHAPKWGDTISISYLAPSDSRYASEFNEDTIYIAAISSDPQLRPAVVRPMQKISAGKFESYLFVADSVYSVVIHIATPYELLPDGTLSVKCRRLDGTPARRETGAALTPAWYLEMALAQKEINDSAANIAVALTALAPGYDPIYNDQEFWNRFFTHVQSGGKLRIDPVKPRLLAPLVERFPNTLMAKTWIQYSDYDTLISPSALASIAAATMSGNDIDEMLLIAKAYGFRKGKIYDPKRALQFCNRAEDCMKAHTGFTSGEDIYANMGRDGKLYEQKILSLGENGYMHEAYVTAKRGLLLCSRQYDKQLIENAIAQAYLAHGDIEDAERAFGIALSHSTRNDLYGMQELYPLAKKGGETFGEFSKRLKNTYGTTLSLPAIPNFKYKTLEGVEGSLAGLRGKVVVIDCWFTSCAGCIVEKKSLNRLVDSFNGDTNVVFLSIALNDPAEVKRFLQQTESKFQVIPYGMPICTKIGVAGYPTHIIIDKAGATLGFELGGSTTVGEGMRPKILEALSLQP